MALYNEEDAPASLAVTFASLGLAANAKAAVRDLWARADLGVVVGRYPEAAGEGVVVAAHEAKLLRITPQ